MKQYTFKIIIALVVFLLLALAGSYGFTVVKIEDVQKAAQSEKFDAVAYVDGIWDSKLIPAFDEKAVELSKILSEIEVDANGAVSKESLIPVTKKYGLITGGEAHVCMVKGSGKIVSVKAETSLGTAEVALDGYEGPIKILLYIGTRIPPQDTSVRDSVGFIQFGDFPSQEPYGAAASEINNHVLKTVLGSIDKESLAGKSITFKGAFSIPTFNRIQIDAKEIKIIPVEIELGE